MLDWYESLPEWLRWILLLPVAAAGTILNMLLLSVVRDDFAFTQPFMAMLVPMILVHFLAPRAKSILALCTVFFRMAIVTVMLLLVYRIEGYFTTETLWETFYEVIGYVGVIFIYWKVLRESEK